MPNSAMRSGSISTFSASPGGASPKRNSAYLKPCGPTPAIRMRAFGTIRVAALAGSARSTGNHLGLSAAMALSEASIYGRGIDIRALDFLIRTRAEVARGTDLDAWVRAELSHRRSLAGYGRPIAAGDERNGPILKVARGLGLADGPFLALAFAIERSLLMGRMRLPMNYGGVLAGLAADMGFSPREYYHFMYPAFLAGMVPCYLEAAENPEGFLFPLPCGDVAYLGAPKRKWPSPRTCGEVA